METWLPSQQEAWDQAIATGSIIPLGKSLDDGTQSMFFIPSYVALDNPNLQSVFDLADHKDLFVNVAPDLPPSPDGRARLVTCVAGWLCNDINEAKIAAYDLESVVQLVDPGDAEELFNSLRGANQNREPWLGYLWEPTRIADELDLTILEEPECSPGKGPETGCAYPTDMIMIAVLSWPKSRNLLQLRI